MFPPSRVVCYYRNVCISSVVSSMRDNDTTPKNTSFCCDTDYGCSLRKRYAFSSVIYSVIVGGRAQSETVHNIAAFFF